MFFKGLLWCLQHQRAETTAARVGHLVTPFIVLHRRRQHLCPCECFVYLGRLCWCHCWCLAINSWKTNPGNPNTTQRRVIPTTQATLSDSSRLSVSNYWIQLLSKSQLVVWFWHDCMWWTWGRKKDSDREMNTRQTSDLWCILVCLCVSLGQPPLGRQNQISAVSMLALIKQDPHSVPCL